MSAVHLAFLQNIVLYQFKIFWRNTFFMNVHRKANVKWALLLLCLLALALCLVACGESGTTSAPTPTPSGTTYTGNGYTLTYPQGWTPKAEGPVVVFTSNSDSNATFTVTTTPALPITNVDQQLNAALKALESQPNYKQDTTVPSTASVGGDTWKQAGATSDKGGQNVKAVVLADQHAQKIFVITLTAKTDSYDQVYNSTFKPMLDSFKFS
jgi:PsbP